MGMLSAFAKSPIPRTASLSSPSLSGFSGFPKFRQSVRAFGIAPTATTLRQASSTEDMPPLYGSSAVNHGLHPMAAASPLRLEGTGRRTEASPGPVLFISPTMGCSTVAALTSWSYCLIAHSFDATLGSDSSLSITVRSSGRRGERSFSIEETCGATYGLW